MSDESKMTVNFNLDSEGFISQECPNCKKRFKVKYGHGSDQPISFCPYCCHEECNCWWTTEQAEYLGNSVFQEKMEPELEKMAKEINRDSRKGGFVTMKMDFKPSPKAVAPKEPEDGWPKILFECCGETIMHDGSVEKLSCIICGEKLLVTD